MYLILRGCQQYQCICFTGKIPYWYNGFFCAFIDRYDCFEDEDYFSLDKKRNYLDDHSEEELKGPSPMFYDSAIYQVLDAEYSRLDRIRIQEKNEERLWMWNNYGKEVCYEWGFVIDEEKLNNESLETDEEDVPTYDDWNELIAYISSFFDKYGYENYISSCSRYTDEGIPLRVLHADDFEPEMLESIEGLASVYRKIVQFNVESRSGKRPEVREAIESKEYCLEYVMEFFAGYFPRGLTSDERKLIAASILAQIYATEKEQSEIEGKKVNKDFLDASRAILHEIDQFPFGLY